MKQNQARLNPRHQERAVARRTKVARKATTYRLEPRFQRGLVLLGAITKKPANRMVNEAVGAYLASQTVQVEAALEATLRRVREYRRADPKFESAMAEFAEAEVTLAGEDPAEGEAASPPGPAQRTLRNLIRG
jgi:hypothetical protein